MSIRSAALRPLLLALACAASPAAAAVLQGVVRGPDGRPIARASVTPYTAGPRVGTDPYCPSCYPDCGKVARTGRDGRFVLRSVSDSLVFRLLVLASGYEPRFVSRVDPLRGPVDVALARRAERRLPPGRVLRGRVVDPEGRRVAGATMSVIGARLAVPGGTVHETFGVLGGLEQKTITDDRGDFLFAAGRDSLEFWGRPPVTAPIAGDSTTFYLLVGARDLAPARYDRVHFGGRPLRLALERGATVYGRLLHDDTPLAGRRMRLESVDRRADYYIPGQVVATDADGRFTFVNVAPARRYLVFGMTADLADVGPTSVDTVEVGPSGTTVAAPRPGFVGSRRFAGRVRLTDGRPIPPGTRIRLSRSDVDDSQATTVSPDGRFAFANAPEGRLGLSVPVPGYRLVRNQSDLRPNNPFQLFPDPAGDVEDYEVVLEPDDSAPAEAPTKPSKP